MKNWKTTVTALIAAFFGFIAFSPDFFPSILVEISKYIAIGGLAAFGISAKDRNVTGGTSKQ